MQGFELRAGARRLMKENTPKVFFVSILFIVITTVMSELQFRLPGVSAANMRFLESVSRGEFPTVGLLYSYFRPGGAALAGLLYLLYPVLETGYKSYCLKTVRGQGGDYRDILDGFFFFGKALLIFIITTIFTALWFMLFFFPAIAARYRYRQAYYILLDAPEKSALQCISESKRMMRGHKMELFLLDLSFLGWYLLDLAVILLLPLPVALPIISIWLTPYMGLTHAAYYGQLVSSLAV